jgi:cellobiose-specific phosphotransferase system component IIC
MSFTKFTKTYTGFTQTVALALTLVSSLYLLICNLGQTPTAIAEQASTYVGYNEKVLHGLCNQKADNYIGMALLLCAFAFELLNRRKDSGEKTSLKGIVAGVSFATVLLVVSFPISNGLSKHFETEARTILSSQSEADRLSR